MADYWKSLPKKYCEICKCWFADNKASVEFHERGFNHQINVKKKLRDIQKKGAKQEREQMKYNTEMMKIETQALKAFQKDVLQNPELVKEFSANKPLVKKQIESKVSDNSYSRGNRFGDDQNDTEEESRTLVFGRERALDTIAKQFEKKSKWLEAKTAEGKSYYWNKETNDTRWKAPKSGFLSLEEQKFAPTNSHSESNTCFKYDPYGKWHTIKNQAFDDKMIDLQLPDQQLPSFCATIDVKESKVKVNFKEKTVDSTKWSGSDTSNTKIAFKKRKLNNDNLRTSRHRSDNLDDS